jgi:O-antigen/teichoic acid export membrane protein
MNRSSVLGFAVGPIGAAVLSFVSLPIMTWIFPQQMIGMISMLQVAISLSTVLCCLGLDQAYVREYHEAVDRPGLLLNAALPGFVIMLVALLAVMLTAPVLLSHLLFGVNTSGLGLLAASCLVVSYLSRFLSLILRMQDRGLAYSMSQVLGKLLLLCIVAGYALLLTSYSFLLLLAAQASALGITLLVFAWNTRHDWIPAFSARIEQRQLARLLAFGWPLVFGSVASWALTAMDRVFLRSMSSYSELAVYSVAASIASGVTIVASIFNTIWSPMVYKWVADKVDMARLDEVANQMAVLMFLIVCSVGASSWILRYLLPHSYAKVPLIVVGCMVSPLFYTLSEVTGVGIAVARRTVFSMLASLGAMLLNVLLCLVLVRGMGATGAMIATASSSWLFFVLRTELSAIAWRAVPRMKQHLYAFCALLLTMTFALLGQRGAIFAPMLWCLVLMPVLYAERRSITLLCRHLLRKHPLTQSSRA